MLKGVFKISLESVVQHSEPKKVLPLDDIFNYVAVSFLLEQPRTAQTEEEEEEIEAAGEEEIREKISDDEPAQIRYSWLEESFLAEQAYLQTQGYENTLYQNRISAEEDEKENYEAAEVGAGTESEAMTSEEANDAIREIQYAVMLGDLYSADADKRDRLSEFIMFNYSLFKLLERTSAANTDVNYDPLV